MELINEFDVSVPIDVAWSVLTDVERIAPCLPGAQLQEIEGDEYRGIVKVKVGPITAQYKGRAIFLESDATAHRLVLDAAGRDTRGAGNASATITAQLTSAGTGTHVTVTTDLTVTGKVAQFGRGVLADVSAKILTQFVDNLEQTVLTDVTAGAAPTAAPATATAGAPAAERGSAMTEESEPAASESSAAAATAPTVRRIDQPEPEAIDLLESAGTPMLKRAVPVLGVAVAAVIIWRLLRRRR
ncbi:MAG: SRPBCC family protein [Acidobacteria bacterium]|nr:SRPBCC family protein [Acidobacteriota bacterium]